METYDMHIYVQHPYSASITPFHSLFLKFWRLPKFKIWKLETSKYFVLYLCKFLFFGKVMQCLSRAWTNIENVFAINQWLFNISQFFSSKSSKAIACKKSFFWSKRSCVWTAKDNNLRQNYEPVMTWHKMCISEVSVMANKSIVRHPQPKLLMKQIWHSIKLTL